LQKIKNSHQCETDAKLDLFCISFACFLRNKIHIFLHILHRFFASTVLHRIVLQRFVYKFFCVLYLILYQTFFFFRPVLLFFRINCFVLHLFSQIIINFCIATQFFRIKCLCFLSLSPVPAPFLWSLSLSPFYASCPFPSPYLLFMLPVPFPASTS